MSLLYHADAPHSTYFVRADYVALTPYLHPLLGICSQSDSLEKASLQIQRQQGGVYTLNTRATRNDGGMNLQDFFKSDFLHKIAG